MIVYPNQILAIDQSLAAISTLTAYGAAPRPTFALGDWKPRSSRVAIVGLFGLLEVEYCIAVRGDVLRAADNDAVEEIVILVNSPGGDVQGVPELSAAVAYAAGKKRVTAIIEGWACSGGYWAIVHATRIIAAPSAVIGSVGCFQLIVDDSEAMASIGLRIIAIKSSELKGGVLPGTPATPAQVEAIQGRVRLVASWFQGAVYRSRKLNNQQIDFALSGDVFYASEAKTHGFIDELAPLGFAPFVTAMDSLLQLAEYEAESVQAEPEHYRHFSGNSARDKFDELLVAAYGDDPTDEQWDELAKKHPTLAKYAATPRTYY